jgi:hypothetical protein
MLSTVLITFILFTVAYGLNTKYLVRKQESHACRIIKQKKYAYTVQCAKSKQPCKPLYIPESKNCV